MHSHTAHSDFRAVHRCMSRVRPPPHFSPFVFPSSLCSSPLPPFSLLILLLAPASKSPRAPSTRRGPREAPGVMRTWTHRRSRSETSGRSRWGIVGPIGGYLEALSQQHIGGDKARRQKSYISLSFFFVFCFFVLGLSGACWGGLLGPSGAVLSVSGGVLRLSWTVGDPWRSSWVRGGPSVAAWTAVWALPGPIWAPPEAVRAPWPHISGRGRGPGPPR